MSKLYLSVPGEDEMWFKRDLEADPKTMDYNAGYNVSFAGYNYNDGTINEDLDNLKHNWLPKWVGQDDKYYAYIMRLSDGVYIGEVYYKGESEYGHEIGVVIKGEYRGNGYATEAIALLCEVADKRGHKLYHQIPDTRKAAIKADLNNGFKIIKDNIPCKFTKFGVRENEVLLIR